MQNITVDFNLMNRYKNAESTPKADSIAESFMASLEHYGRGENFKLNNVTEVEAPETNSYIVRVEFATDNPLFADNEIQDNDVKKDIMFAAENVQFNRSLIFESHKMNLALVS